MKLILRKQYYFMQKKNMVSLADQHLICCQKYKKNLAQNRSCKLKLKKEITVTVCL